MEHARLSPSSAHRWRRCPAAPSRSEGLPDVAGIEAAIGSCFHEYTALALEFGIPPHHFIGAEYVDPDHGVILYDQEMADNALYGLDYLADLAAPDDAIVLVERRVDLSGVLGENQFGTSDVCVIIPSLSRLVVFDWKYGKGEPVSPILNDQLMLYAIGCWDTHGWKYLDADKTTVDLIIEQPRAPGGGGVWSIPMTELLQQAEEFAVAAKATLEPEPPAIPGPVQCKYCAAAKFNACQEFIENTLNMFDLSMEEAVEFAELEAPPPMPDVSVLPSEVRSWLILHGKVFTRWLDQLHADAYDDAVKGRPVPNMKLVDGRANRDWKDPDKAAIALKRTLGEQAYVSKMVSPAQAQDLVGKKAFAQKFEKYQEWGERKPILVPETDKRDAIASVVERFDSAMDDSLI